MAGLSCRSLAHGAAVAAVALLAAGLSACAQAPQQVSAPELIEVAAWGGQPTPTALPAQHIHQLTLHHQGSPWAADADPAAYLRRLQQWSQLTQRWADIPYHFVIAPDGRIYTARPIALPGDTNTEYDPKGHALVMLLGNFEHQTPTPAAIESSVALLAWLAQQHGLRPEHIGSHRDFSQQTLCPGANLQALLPAIRQAVKTRLRP
jgi:hypothetical protein